MSRLWIITYDISDDRTRYRIADILKNYGIRVQYSIFECRLTGTELATLRAGVTGLLDPGDSVRWYPLCRWCRADICWQGQGSAPDNPEFFQI